MRDQLQRLGSNTLIYGVGGILNRLANLLVLPVFTAYLTPADYGISSILGVLALLVNPVFSLGLGTAIGVCYFDSSDPERRRTTISTALITVVGSTFVLLSLGVTFGSQISELAFQTPAYNYLVIVSLSTTGLGILSMPLMLYLQLQERAKAFVAVTLSSTVLTVTLTTVMVVALRKGVQGMIEAGFVAQFLTLALCLLVVLPQLEFRFSRTEAKDLLVLGIPMIPSFAFHFLLQHGNKYILQLLSGVDTVGVYTVGLNLGLAMTLVVSGFQSAWMPYFMSFVDKQQIAPLLFGRIATYYIFGAGTLALMFFITAKPVVAFLTQPPFHSAHQVVGLAATSQFLTGLYSILLPGMYFAKEVRYVPVVQAAAAVLSLILNFLLISVLGMAGAGLGLAFGVLSMVILQHIWNQMKSASYFSMHFEWSRILRFGLIYLMIAALSFWNWNLGVIPELSISVVESVLLMVLVFRLLTTEEKSFIRALMHRVAHRAQGNTHLAV